MAGDSRLASAVRRLVGRCNYCFPIIRSAQSARRRRGRPAGLHLSGKSTATGAGWIELIFPRPLNNENHLEREGECVIDSSDR